MAAAPAVGSQGCTQGSWPCTRPSYDSNSPQAYSGSNNRCGDDDHTFSVQNINVIFPSSSDVLLRTSELCVAKMIGVNLACASSPMGRPVEIFCFHISNTHLCSLKI